MILLHGLFGASDNWHPVATRLAKKFHVFALDQRNHGQSPHSAEMNFSLMAGDVDEFMVAQGLPTALVVGHSMGGKTAMQFALQYPGRVEKLVVGDMAPRKYAPTHDKIFAALLALNLAVYQSRQQIEEALADSIPNLVLRRFLLKNLGRDAEGRFFWKINLCGLAESYPNLCAPVFHPRPFTKPALFIRGGRSDYVNATDEALIHGLFPQAQIQTIEKSGHWVHADATEEFLERLLNFL
ncbi:MAG TPA: alpha/beta fold hydrolase [Candidatus Binatia bacterium]|nr:alpha/beta fold hydrolase [Candidatus Binatia bacterium]